MLIEEFMQEIVRNFHIKDLYKITNPIVREPVNLKNSFNEYKIMHELSVQSYRQNLLGDWELIELTGEKNTIQDCFKSTYSFIKEFWHTNYPCNILYTNADTLCIKELDIFDKFIEFRLFTDSDPVKLGEYINAGVKYFPSRLNKEFWDRFDNEYENWADDDWLYEQNMAINLMFSQSQFDYEKSQDWVVKQVGLRHHILINDLTEGNFHHAILHFHSSQNPGFRLNCMQELWRKLND
jgi:hypothetical protein